MGWLTCRGPLGEIAFFGGFNQEIVDLMVKKKRRLLLLEDRYFSSGHFVFHSGFGKPRRKKAFCWKQILSKNEPNWPIVRQLIFTKKTEREATFSNLFLPHATTIEFQVLEWACLRLIPFYLMQALEANEYEILHFFCSGKRVLENAIARFPYGITVPHLVAD